MKRLALILVVVVAVCGGCPFLPDNDLGSFGSGTQFIALAHDFAGFRTWPTFHVDNSGDGGVGGARDVYVSADVDGDEFAVGTIIVKGGLIADDGEERVHAMVKRSKRADGFNENGARGWEWFEIAESGADVVIEWRGEDAPAGECYGLLPGQTCDADQASCNACHAASSANDSVQSAPLQMGSIDDSLLLRPHS
jgi:hypothetical protein